MSSLRRVSRLIGAAAVLAVLAMTAPAQASLIGQTITCADSFFICVPASATVIEPGVEFIVEKELTSAPNAPVFEIDVGDKSIRMEAVGGDEFGDIFLTLGDLIWSNDPSAEIAGITNFMSDSIDFLEESAITAIGNTVIIDYRDTEWLEPGAFLSFDLVTTHVPAPATLGLFLMALGGLGVATRRRHRL